MSLFGGLKAEGVEESKDVLGGGSFAVDTAVYDATIKLAYAGESSGGAMSVTVLLDLETGGGTTEYRSTEYVTSREKKNFYEKDGKKHFLPGFTTINELCMLTVETPLMEISHEIKKVNQYDPELKKEVPKDAPVLVDLTGKKVKVAIFKDLENKTKKEGNDYVTLSETVERNTISKFFHGELGVTLNEAKEGTSTPTFLNKWVEKWEGKVRDRTKKTDAKKGSPKSGGGSSSSEPKKSLFG
jgi:hypothetical protein